MSSTIVILLVASVAAASCAIVGTFLVLRRMALLGDAISHAVLPGIVIAFLMTGDRSPLPMVIGAGALGVVTVFLVEMFLRTRRLKEDASIGVVFPALFSIGVILISRYAGQVDLDLDCVLYGEIAYSPLDLVIYRDVVLGPKALWINGAILLVNLLFVGLLFKELKLTTFDAQLAATLGFSPILVHYLLMSSVSLTVVGAFESVGAILVLALLVVPPAAAYLWTDRLNILLTLAVSFGVLSAIGGYFLARWWDASIAGSIALATGIVFLFSLTFSGQHGVLGRWRVHRKLGWAMAEQLMLLHMDSGRPMPLDVLVQRFSWPRGRFDRVVSRLLAKDWISRDADGLRLTTRGAEALETSGQSELRHPLVPV
ncbi:MAG: metal ABC transporter permease [Acidobacteriota bacterium]|nr:metal ABC transporter permease [Acidobacteriota bacterium]